MVFFLLETCYTVCKGNYIYKKIITGKHKVKFFFFGFFYPDGVLIFLLAVLFTLACKNRPVFALAWLVCIGQ